MEIIANNLAVSRHLGTSMPCTASKLSKKKPGHAELPGLWVAAILITSVGSQGWAGIRRVVGTSWSEMLTATWPFR